MTPAEAFDLFVRDYARKLRADDVAPRTQADWKKRRETLRERMFAAMGGIPEIDCPLEPRLLGTVKRDGYRIEKLILQSRPDVWITASAYVPEIPDGKKAPAVLVVHGHWAWARRDPVVQARCLGLVKLGFFVLAVDAFGAGERFTNPGRGTYHGALYGSTLWPSGHSLLGMQVYDNRRAVDYLLTRPEVNGKLGITGASGGGNQSMYAGALDERFAAVVPVCSVGNYQSYLRAACCVCEVLPGALQFTEEGDVLGLVAPRALLVINASKDGIQFSPAEAEKSVARAKDIFALYDAGAKLRHQVFESPHDYNKAMREAMYGWMTLHLKGEGKGEPIPEPEHKIETIEELTCFPDPKDRPKGFLFPPSFAAAAGKELVAKVEKLAPDHKEMWEATGANLRDDLKKIVGAMPSVKAKADEGPAETREGIARGLVRFEGEHGLPISANYWSLDKGAGKTCILLHLEGSAAALGSPPVSALIRKFDLLAPNLRATGETKPKNDAIAGSPDHNSAEHALWTGRPLLNHFLTDVQMLLDWLEAERKQEQVAIAGFGQAGLVALAAAALFPERIGQAVLIGAPASYISDTAYATGTSMGLLVPGILKAGDVPHLAGLIAPRRLIIADAVSPQGKKLTERELEAAFSFTKKVYKAMEADKTLTLVVDPKWDDIHF